MRTRIVAVAMFSAALGFAQTSQVFDFTNKPTQQGLQEIATILRTVGDIQQLSIDAAASTITVTGTTDQLAMSGWIVHQIDQPVPLPATAPQPGAGSSQQFLVAGKSDDVIQVFHLTTAAPQPPQPMQEILTVLRTVAGVQKIFDYSALADLVIRGSAAQIALSGYLVNSLDVAKGSVAAAPEFQYQSPSMGPQVARVFYLANASTPQAVQEILTSLRTVVDIQKVFNFTKINAIAILATANDIATSAWLIQSLDIPVAPKNTNANAREYHIAPSPTGDVIRVFYPANITTTQSLNQTLTLIRTNLQVMKAFTNSKPAALVVRGSADQIAKADQLIQDRDKPTTTTP